MFFKFPDAPHIASTISHSITPSPSPVLESSSSAVTTEPPCQEFDCNGKLTIFFPVKSTFGRCEQYNIDSMIDLLGNEVYRWNICLKMRPLG